MKKLFAEFFGTFWLVFGGCGSAIFTANYQDLGIGFYGVAVAFGLTVLTMTFAVGPVSGPILTQQSLLVFGPVESLPPKMYSDIFLFKFLERLLLPRLCF